MTEKISDVSVDDLMVERDITEIKPERHLGRKIAAGIGLVALGAGAVLVPIGVKAYKQGYAAVDNCTGLDKQAVSVLEYRSMANASRALHERVAGIIPTFWTDGAVNLNDVVETQKQVRGNQNLDVTAIAEANQVSDPNKAFNPGVYCLEGFGPTVQKVNGQALVEGAPVSSLWAATSNTSGDEQAKVLGASARANAAEISQNHAFPGTGTYPFATEFYDNILATPGLTDQAKQAFQQEVASAGLTPLG